MSNGEVILVMILFFIVVLVLFEKNGFAFLIFSIVFISLLHILRSKYKKIYFKIKQVRVIDGIICNTFTEEKTILVPGGVRRGVHFIFLKFNCIEISDLSGQRYKVYETYNKEKEYSGKYSEGESISISVMKYDRYYFMEESLFREIKK